MIHSLKRTVKFLLFPAPAQRPAGYVSHEPPAPLATAAWAAAINSAYPCG